MVASILDNFSNADKTTWIALVLGLVGVALLLFKGKYRTRKDPLERQPVFSSLAQQRTVERQMQNLLVELSEMSRQISAQLDNRAAKLDALIREADEKIAQLRDAGNGSFTAPAPSRETVPAPAQRPWIESTIEVAATAPMEHLDPRHVEIYALADAGRGTQEIAAQLGQPSGEIELILALRRRA